MLGRRLISAAVIISGMLLLIWGDVYLGNPDDVRRPGMILCGLAVVVAGMAASELMAMWGSAANGVRHWVGIVGAMLMVAIFSIRAFIYALPDCPVGAFGWVVLGIVTAIGFAFLTEMYSYEGAPAKDPDAPEGSGSAELPAKGAIATRLGIYALCFGYLAMLFGFLMPHRILESNAVGMVSLIALIATVKMSDSFAYFTGKSFGKHKLIPRLSPGKTIEGAIGAVFGGWFAAAIVVFLVAPYIFGVTIDKPWWWILVYGLLVTITGMIGDLAESLIKRDAQCKDSSSWLPGLGGILDIIDSLVFAAPMSYFLWLL